MMHLWTRSDNKRIGFACILHRNSIASHGANPGWQATEPIDRDARAMRWLVIAIRVLATSMEVLCDFLQCTFSDISIGSCVWYYSSI